MFEVIKQLENTSSSKEKLCILKENQGNELLKKVFYLALSPRVKFFIKKIPEFTPKSTHSLSLNLLDMIISRQLTGNMARNHLVYILESLSPEDSEIVCRIIEKDLKCGVNATTANKVWKGLVETTPYMGAIAFNKKKAEALFKNEKRGVFSQTKMDGRYVNAHIFKNEEPFFESRSGEITHLGSSFKDLSTEVMDGLILNGELTIPGVSRYDSNGMIASIVSINKKGGNTEKEENKFYEKYGKRVSEVEQQIQLTVWDCISREIYIKGFSTIPYISRFKELEDFVKNLNHPRVKIVDSTPVPSLEEAFEDWQTKVSKGEEGTIIKGLSGGWKDGKPNWQIKVKLEFSVDLKMVGFNFGTPGTRLEHTVGSLICVSDCGNLQTNPAGITDEDRDYIFNNWEELKNKYVEVTCSGVSQTDNGFSLLHPRFNRIRDDKTTGDTLWSIKQIENGIKQIRK